MYRICVSCISGSLKDRVLRLIRSLFMCVADILSLPHAFPVIGYNRPQKPVYILSPFVHACRVPMTSCYMDAAVYKEEQHFEHL